MPYSNYLLRYFYIWATAVVLITEAITGFEGRMEITFFSDDPVWSIPIWQFILGLALFLILAGLAHCWIDNTGRLIPRWVKIGHPVTSVLFSVAVFAYLQVLENRRLSNPKRYFQADQLRYWEEMNLLVAGLAILFLLAQVLLVFYLFRSNKNRLAPN